MSPTEPPKLVFREPIVGDVVLVGLTVYDHKNTFLRKEQKQGRVIEVDPKHGVGLELFGTGEKYYLPPDLTRYQVAPPGTYRSVSTNETVENQDLLTYWIVTKPAPKENPRSFSIRPVKKPGEP